MMFPGYPTGGQFVSVPQAAQPNHPQGPPQGGQQGQLMAIPAGNPGFMLTNLPPQIPQDTTQILGLTVHFYPSTSAGHQANRRGHCSAHTDAGDAAPASQ
uniref:Uncharacterized protein n=1 Tax=Vitrella brassicaformis TaxID=1169539 RepID=A0A7S1JWA1_9ALVE|mmetsp:Transcript_43499/g.123197  ORF Transcript_43499/g.123197 Transcript_43499/m.123197 type:complete len:100 (+) Transcript_43499:37-336(+)